MSSRKGGAMKISPKMIAACEDAGACSEGLNWISAKPRTVEQLYKHDPYWFLWLRNILSKSARDAYSAAMKPALDAYDAAMKPARVKSASDAYYAAAKFALIAALRKDGYR